MKPLIIYAHPNVKGHCSKILDEVISKLNNLGIKKYDLIDLYKIKYDPVLNENELYTAGNTFVSKENQKYQELIKNAEKIIFIHPMWWGGMPAILKGFIDKVFVSGYAFKYSKIGISKLLSGKALILLTSGSSEKIYFFYRAPLKALSTTLKFCGFKTKVLLYGNARHEPDEKKIKKMVDSGLNWLF